MPKPEHTPDWKKVFAGQYIGASELKQKCPEISQDELKQVDALFPVQLTKSLLDNHPIDGNVLRQYLPNAEELVNPPGYITDPVGDQQATQLNGVIQKYQHRVLLITTHTCPVHCRYCFRKAYPYPKENPNKHKFSEALNFIAQDTSLNEVILSGGDPLSLEDKVLAHLIHSLEKIPHIKTVRLHTKFPSIVPERITQDFLHTLQTCTLNKVCVFHINHPDEITEEFCAAVNKIKATHTTTLNQSVLLKGVNDNPKTLIQLSQRLFSTGILPYYLHLLDHAQGTHHFHVKQSRVASIVDAMKIALPGYLVPKIAQEIAGEKSKKY